MNERLAEIVPCPIGLKSMCCRNCLMGPCRLLKQDDVGACGANLDVVSARNILRFVAGGTAAHAGHAWHILEHTNREFPEKYIEKKAPPYLQKIWQKLGLMPSIKHEHFKEISEALHASTMGVNADYQDLLCRAVKLGIIDGYLGLYLATELEDKLHGHNHQIKGKINLGVIKPEKINIAVHGHEIMFAAAIAKEAKKDSNINLIGVCCTGASLLSKFGISLASHVVFQEEVIATRAIDAMVLDSQCVMPSLASLAECFKTPIITTNPLAKITNVLHLPVENEPEAKETAKKIIEIARKNYQKRSKSIKISQKEVDAVVGFDETIADKLNSQLKNKEIKGIIGVIGCKNPRVQEDWISIYRNLSKDYAILTTGCMAFELGIAGLLDGKRFFHMGSCINNAHIAETFRIIAEKNKKRITDMPFLISAPAPLTEKCVAIGFFFAALGVDVHFGYPMMISSDTNVEHFLENVLKKHFQSKIYLETNPRSFYARIRKG